MGSNPTSVTPFYFVFFKPTVVAVCYINQSFDDMALLRNVVSGDDYFGCETYIKTSSCFFLRVITWMIIFPS